MKKIYALTLLLFGLNLGAGEIVTLEGIREVDLAGWPEEGPLPLVSGEKLDRNTFVEWDAGIIASSRPGSVHVELTNGVAFRGEIKNFGDDGITIHNNRMGEKEYGYDTIWAIVFLDQVPSLPLVNKLRDRMLAVEAGEDDTLFLANDHIEGTLDSVSANKLSFEIGGELSEFTLNKVYGVRFPNERKVVESPLSLVIKDGLILPVTKMSWGEALSVESPLGKMKFAVMDIARLVAHNDKHMFLGSLKPSTVEEALPGQVFPGPYRWSYQINRSVHYRRPIWIKGRQASNAIGVHSDSKLGFDVPEGALELTGACALDSESQGEGSVHFRVYTDGKKVFDSTLMTGKDKPKRFKVNLKGVKKLLLECVTDPDDKIKSFTLDRAAWFDLILIKE